MHTAAPTLAAVMGKDFPFESKKWAEERNDVTLSRRIRLSEGEKQVTSIISSRPLVDHGAHSLSARSSLLHGAITKSGGAVEQALFRENSHNIQDALKENITKKRNQSRESTCIHFLFPLTLSKTCLNVDMC
jgi:hypothetical protein